MQVDLNTKLKVMLWDMPEVRKIKIADETLPTHYSIHKLTLIL